MAEHPAILAVGPFNGCLTLMCKRYLVCEVEMQYMYEKTGHA